MIQRSLLEFILFSIFLIYHYHNLIFHIEIKNMILILLLTVRTCSPVAALVQAGLTIDFSATIQHNDRLPNQDAATDDVRSFVVWSTYDFTFSFY